MYSQHLSCKECESKYPLDAIYFCSHCFGPLEVVYDYQDLADAKRKIERGPANLWRYSDFLPCSAEQGSSFGPGFTPILKAERLATELGIGEVWIKNDAANPTHSFKDRVVAVALAKALELGYTDLACASTGNLANAVAAAAAAAGINSHVFIPASLEETKVLATAVYGGEVIKIDGDYDHVNRLCLEMLEEHDQWGFVNINLRPYYAEGSKTLAYETMEQLGFRMPTAVIAPIASGSLYTKLGRGFSEWKKVGLVEGRLPRMFGAQASGCAPVAEAYERGLRSVPPVKVSDTLVSSLAIGTPADGPYALELANSSAGIILSIDEKRVGQGVRMLAEKEGVFTEMTGGVVICALEDLVKRNEVGKEDSVVIYLTGEGLKTLDTFSHT
jgi:threonine synthase